MSLTKAQLDSNKRYDQKNMAYQTIKIRRATLEEFRRLVQLNGDKVNTVLRQAIEDYITSHTPPAPAPTPDQLED